MSDVIIVGAGITGLSCAWTLRKLGIQALVLESGNRVGGSIQTHRIDGYVVEGGPTTLLPRPETLQFIDELGLSPQLAKSGGSRFIYTGGRLRRVPFGAFSLPGFLRLLAEPFIRSKSPTDESVFDFFRRRMGPETADLVATAVTGIYAGDARDLSAAATFPRIMDFERTYGSLLVGMFRSRLQRRGRHVGSSTFRGGFETLPTRIAQDLDVRLGSSQTRISDAKVVVIAVPAYSARKILERDQPSIARLLETVEYAPIVIAAVALPKGSFQRPLSGFGFLVPRSERMHVLGAIFASTLFPERAPEGMQLLSSFVGGAFEPEAAHWPDERVWDTVSVEMRRILETSSSPQPVVLVRHEHALPQYKIGHERFVAALCEELRQSPGLFLAGNYLEGPGVADCINQGRRTAQAVAEYLRRKP